MEPARTRHKNNIHGNLFPNSKYAFAKKNTDRNNLASSEHRNKNHAKNTLEHTDAVCDMQD